ncbi:MAG: hypothetical protein ACXVB4_19225 [Pseudobdellovibrionaceae bacterium]
MLGLCGNIIRAEEPPKETPILIWILKDDQTVSVALPNTPDSLRLAKPQEVDLIAQWIVEFSEESLPPPERKSFEDRRS